ncbi:MAG TPA: winged helix-turn-helix domain-containing protein [Chloroflexia bacterium]|nr:winged helix-turn-helix domain-containing protein [Chloroflexia bacterium]
MTDQTENADQSLRADYEMAEVMQLTTPEQFRAIGDPTRTKLLGLLSQRAATTKQLAGVLNMPKGSAGHHLKVLEAAGLIRVVRTRQVRAITEKYYGRVARLYRSSTDVHGPHVGDGAIAIPHETMVVPLRQALSEFTPSPDKDDPSMFLINHARIPASLAREFALRLEALSEEFGQKGVAGEKVYGLVAGIYLTDIPDLSQLPTDDAE